MHILGVCFCWLIISELLSVDFAADIHIYIHTVHTILFQHARPKSISMLISMEGVYKNTYKRDNYIQNCKLSKFLQLRVKKTSAALVSNVAPVITLADTSHVRELEIYGAMHAARSTLPF